MKLDNKNLTENSLGSEKSYGKAEQEREHNCLHHIQQSAYQPSLPTSLESDYQCLIRSLTCQSLNELPTELNLTPVKGKAPYLPDWQNLALTRGQIEHQILANSATGYGLITGNGLLAIDVDGPLADTRLNKISGRDLPKTPSWTSGKPGRRQLVYRLSRSAQTVLDAVSFTRKFIDCGEGEQLDFRYNCCQSVLPPSFHPETGQYRWLVSFAEVDIAPAPEWLEALLVEWAIASRPKPKSITETAREYQEGRTIKHSLTQAWGDRVAPGRIRQNEGLMLRWNGLRITAKGQTNSVLLEFCRLLKESGINCETAIAEFRHFAIQIPGYSQHASRDSKRDLENSTWAERIVINWWKKDGYSGYLSKRDTDLNQTRQDAAIKRIEKAVRHGIEKGIEKVTDWINWIQEFTLREFGIETSRKTLYKHLLLWHPEHRNTGQSAPPRVELLLGVEESVTASLSTCSTPSQFSPQFTLLTGLAIAAAALKPKPKPEPQKPAQVTFKKGDRVIVDDRTSLPYCGKEATVTGVLEDRGTPLYRLDIDCQGRKLKPRQRKNAMEALPSFLRHVQSRDVPWDNTGTTPGQPTEVWAGKDDIRRLKIPDSHWLYAICGGATPNIAATKAAGLGINSRQFKRQHNPL